MGLGNSTSRLRTAFGNRGRPTEKRKVLVLGCMGSGKTTMCRMLVRSSRTGTGPCRPWKHTIENNLLEVFKALIEIALENNIAGVNKFEDDLIILKNFRHKEDLHKNAVDAMRRVLKSSLYADVVKDKKRLLDLPYNTPFYMQNAERILDPKFEPTDADMITVYSMTVGVNYQAIDIGMVTYELYELPGHNIFRKWWPEFYNNTTAVIFVIDLSDLCRSAFYNGGHLQDKVRQILLKVVMSPFLHQTSFILLFNKRDLLEEIGQAFNFQQLGAGVKSWEAAEKWYMEQCQSAVPPTNMVYYHSMTLTKKPDMNITLVDSLDKIREAGMRSIDLE